MLVLIQIFNTDLLNIKISILWSLPFTPNIPGLQFEKQGFMDTISDNALFW